MKKWMTATVTLFVFLVVLMPLAAAQEEADFVPPSPTEIVTLQLVKPPQVHHFIQAKYPVFDGPNLDEGDDGDTNFNDPSDPFQVESSARMTTTSYAVANPTSQIVGGGGALLSAGRSGASASSSAQDARRSIKKLIKQLY